MHILCHVGLNSIYAFFVPVLLSIVSLDALLVFDRGVYVLLLAITCLQDTPLPSTFVVSA